MKTKNIILVGLMGAGKTTVGKELAKLLHYSFLDIDDEIEKNEKRKISKIFQEDGEPYFRQLETNTIKNFENVEKIVLSTGGGALQKDENITALQKTGTLVYLQASVDTLYQRLLNEIDNRPMLHEENPKQKLSYLLQIREKNYLKADITIQTENKKPQEICQEIYQQLNL